VQELASGGIELVHHVIVTARQNVLGIIRKFDGREATILGGKFLDASARVKVPELGDSVARGRYEEISTELDCVNRAVMSSEFLEMMTRPTIPDVDCCVFRAGDDILVVQTNV
jgi:hypothetical protein